MGEYTEYTTLNEDEGSEVESKFLELLASDIGINSKVKPIPVELFDRVNKLREKAEKAKQMNKYTTITQTLSNEQLVSLLPKLLTTIENLSTELSEAILEVNSERMKYNRRRSDKDVRRLDYNSVVDAQILLAEIMEEVE